MASKSQQHDRKPQVEILHSRITQISDLALPEPIQCCPSFFLGRAIPHPDLEDLVFLRRHAFKYKRHHLSVNSIVFSPAGLSHARDMISVCNTCVHHETLIRGRYYG
jgi:hypothetical protein